LFSKKIEAVELGKLGREGKKHEDVGFWEIASN
jgi:hypothetical protein